MPWEEIYFSWDQKYFATVHTALLLYFDVIYVQ